MLIISEFVARTHYAYDTECKGMYFFSVCNIFSKIYTTYRKYLLILRIARGTQPQCPPHILRTKLLKHHIMKKLAVLLLAAVAISVVAFAIYRPEPSMKLIEELPSEEILPYRNCSMEVADGSILMTPPEGKLDAGFEIQGNYDLSKYKCARFTVENLNPAPMRLYVSFSHENTSYLRG